MFSIRHYKKCKKLKIFLKEQQIIKIFIQKKASRETNNFSSDQKKTLRLIIVGNHVDALLLEIINFCSSDIYISY